MEDEGRDRKGKQTVEIPCFVCHKSLENCVCPLLGNRDNRGENAPPSAPVGNQPHVYHPMGQQSGVAPPQFSGNPQQFVVQQQQLEQQEQRGPSAPQQIQIPGSNPPYIATTAAAQQQQLLQYMEGLMSVPCSTAGVQPQQQERLHQIMAEVADVAGIPPQSYQMPHAYETFSTTGAQQQQLQHMAEQGFGRPPQAQLVTRAYETLSTTVVLPYRNLPPPQEHPAVPVGYNPAITRAAASNAREDGINPGQNAAPPRSLNIQTHPTRWQPGGVVLGGSTWLRPSPMARCPSCRFCAMYNNTICMVCAVRETVNANAGLIPEVWKCSVCRLYQGALVDQPWRHVCLCAVCRFCCGAVCSVCSSG